MRCLTGARPWPESDVRRIPERIVGVGIGSVEAPRGTLTHHYVSELEPGVLQKVNLIVSTTSNNEPMNRAVASVAREYLDGQTITEGLLNHIEVAIRCFDPCLSCATHALGQMPLEVELLDAEGTQLSRMQKDTRAVCTAE